MPIMTSVPRAIRGFKPVPGWGLTRRVVFDADEEENQLPVQAKSTSKAQHDTFPLVKSTQEKAQSSPRLIENTQKTDARPRQAPTSKHLFETR